MRVTVGRVGQLGHGIVQAEGGTIYAPGLLPGEVAEGELAGTTLTDIRILTPSAHRVRPPCAHARTCGGCLMQHADDGFVVGWKEGIVRGALAGQGLEALLLPSVTSPPQSRRRATLTGRKTKSGALVGFHARASDTVVAIPQCRLLHHDLIAALPGLEALVRLGATRTAEVQLTVTRSLDGPDVLVTGGRDLDGALRMDLARLTETQGWARLTWSGETVALRGGPRQRMGRALVTPPPGAFLQATEAGEAALVAAVRSALGPARRVADLFAGCGTFALPLAERSEVHAVEGEAAMVQALGRAARAAEGLKRVSTETRDLFRRPLEPDELAGFDAVVMDPPRAGAEAQTAALARAMVPVLAYVSCNPASFARDARALVAAGYALDWVQMIDQFRWSAHVELVARFTFAKAGPARGPQV